jgi:hypothetical protein
MKTGYTGVHLQELRRDVKVAPSMVKNPQLAFRMAYRYHRSSQLASVFQQTCTRAATPNEAITSAMRRFVLLDWRRMVFLACWGLIVSGCGPTLLGPTVPSGYRIHLPKASQTLRGQPIALTVRVTDAAGKPVDDVPVHFRLPDPWMAVAQVDPPIVNTLHGDATTTFRARTEGQMTVHIQVEDLSATVAVVVLGDTPRF